MASHMYGGGYPTGGLETNWRPTFDSPVGSYDPLRTRLDETTDYLQYGSPSSGIRTISPSRYDRLSPRHADESIDARTYRVLLLRNKEMEAQIQALEAQCRRNELMDRRYTDILARDTNSFSVRPEDVRIAELEAEVDYLRRKLSECLQATANPTNTQSPRSIDPLAHSPSIRTSRKPQRAKAVRSAGATRTAPRQIDWRHADRRKWHFEECSYNGAYQYHGESKPVLEKCQEQISRGIQKLKEDPASYLGIFYQSNMLQWPTNQQRYTLVKRTGSGFHVTEQRNGPFTYMEARYFELGPCRNLSVDKYTDGLHFQGYRLAPPRSPGRGEGCSDVPGLKIIGDIDPSDVNQGGVGDCWLLSAISSLAEYDGVIAKLFRKTPGLNQLPRENSNMYVVTLYDLRTGNPVDIQVDERLCYKADNSGLLGCVPSVDGELWPCYLEKAAAIHCGGWDKIDGGDCTHGWRILTGCKDCYTITRDASTGLFRCFGSKHPSTGQYLDNENSVCSPTMYMLPWPDVGGGGLEQKVNDERMFEKMCHWDDNNFLMACGTKTGSDKNSTDGIVDGHAYSILDVVNNAGGTEIDLIKVRNPWGHGEIKTGKWDDDGPGWFQYPQVKEACKPVAADDGVFWMEKGEFFKYFKSIYLCACDMAEFARR